MTPERLRPTLVTLVRITAVAAALLVLTVLVVNRSKAAFSDTTANTGNAFASGSIVLNDDDSGTAMFTTSDMAPGTPAVKCLALTYSGTITPSAIRTYGTSSGALAPYLDMTIEVGSGGGFGSCAGFTPSATIFTGTLSGFSATHTDWSSGLATLTAATNPTTRTLRFTVEVQDDNAAQALSAAGAFTFEAQS